MRQKFTPLGFTALALLAFSGCAHAPQSGRLERWSDRPASAEAHYLARFSALDKAGGQFSTYDILGPVDGAKVALAPAKDAPMPPALASSVAKVVDYAGTTNSSALIVWHDGRILTERYFGSNGATTALVSKSLAKPLAVVAIGRAIKLGKIRGLDQRVDDFITEWRGTPKATMSIRHVLAMETGLLEQSFVPGPYNHWSRAYLDPYHERYIVDEYPLTNPPGTVFGYSNAAADLVAIIIKRATGQDYRDFVGQQILKPMGAAGGTIWLNRQNGVPHSGCCISLPAQTWLKLALLLLEDGRVGRRALLPLKYVAEIRKPSAHNEHSGLGVWLGQPYAERRGFSGPKSPVGRVLHSAPYRAEDLFLFDGNGNQTVYIVPSKRLVILRIGASPTKPAEWDNSLIPNLILDGLASPQ